MSDTIMVDGKEYKLAHVEKDYSTPKATKFLDMAIKKEVKDPVEGQAWVDKLLNKAAEAEAKGQ